MKKLIIVAAVAAIAGTAGAVAGYDQLYQATFNLKTTVGKTGNATINLGKNAAGKFWYSDTTLNTWLDNTKPVGEMIKNTDEAKKFFTYKKVKGSNVPVPTADGLAAATLNDKLVTLSTTYNKKSDNTWCVSFKNEVCYRVAGTIKVTGWINDDECLSHYWGFADAFGGATLEACKSAEAYCVDLVAAGFFANLFKTANAAWNGGDNAEVLDNLKTERTLQVLAVAGHGAFGKVYSPIDDKATEPGVTSISGNAVGTVNQGVCTSCCLPDTPVVPLDCCFYAVGDTTAVFGTFTLKYNLAQTKSVIY